MTVINFIQLSASILLLIMSITCFLISKAIIKELSK